MPKKHQGRARHGMDMAMPAMSHLDTFLSPSLPDQPRHRVQRVAHDPRRSPVPAPGREDADRSRTTRAQYDRGDVVNTTPSSPSPLDPRNGRAIVDLAAAPTAPHAPIKGGLASTISSHQLTPLSFLDLPSTSPCSISHRRRPIDVSPPRKPCSNRAEKEAAPDDATLLGASPSSTTSSRTLPNPGAPMEPNEPLNTKFYQLGNGGDLIFEHDLNALSDFLGRPHPEFHGIEVNDQVGGELQWIITADLRGKLEPPTSERILFSFRESNWLDGLARGLQEALARLCGQNMVRILASRYAHLVRRDAMGVPMELQSHPQLRHHAEHLDYMLYHTQKELDNSRAYANQTHLALITHGDAIKQLSRDRNKLRLKCAKKDVTITRLRAQIASLEATVKAQEEQLMEIEEDEAGADLRGGDAFLSDDDDFEEDGFTEEEDYEFLEPGPDDVVPIDIEDEGSHT
ncbi:hypothetical protein QYE76_066590 [Lolium multiflorum]|uniref:Uncharacterized protein n=1 Tax=Lolium multiflorum TaxID=4521 RepID=A0AAD8WAW0_LOLMU|nr:hypothetical protein QYE76_066590 [Lolium multiflorum]